MVLSILIGVGKALVSKLELGFYPTVSWMLLRCVSPVLNVVGM
jgi:hypothetical protein